MTQVQVVKELGPGQAFIKSEEFTLKRRNEQERCCLVYQIATTKVPGLARKSAPIELTIVFKHDHVQSYSVEAIY